MKLSRSSVRRTLAAGLVIACLLAWVSPAYAALEDTPTVTSPTNPDGTPTHPTYGWGNTLYPQFTFSNIPAASGLPTLGFYYRILRHYQEASATPDGTVTRTVLPDPALAPEVGISWDPAGSMVTHDYDLAGIYDSLPVAERTYAPLPGEQIHDPREGTWYLCSRFFNGSDVATQASWHAFRVDLTAPKSVAGFTSGVVLPTEASRRSFTWWNTQYDDLSGLVAYRIYVNDPITPFTAIPFVPSLPGKFTLEHLNVGYNAVGIQTLDLAGNASPIVWRTEVVDPDVPSLSIVTPAANAYLRGTAVFSVTASDLAGIASVTYKVDGVVKATTTSIPYLAYVDTTKLSAGKHTMTATAKDLFGHTRAATRTFYVDNVAPTISAISDTPDPFYPVLHDDYKDEIKIAFTVNEPTQDLWVRVYQVVDGVRAPNAVYTWHGTDWPAGDRAIWWDGRDASDSLAMGPLEAAGPLTASFSYQISATDRAGNIRSSGYYPFVYRNFEMVKTSSGSVNVVAR